ncbi:MAG: hypothetical protein DMF68_09985 [Acidobacteria bacterium]|nr:MAG: hypothetical protein DMF68_09985 [Acidobacteriota bacterium]
MLLRRLALFFALLALSATATRLEAQSGRQPAPQKSPEQREDQERVKVFTEEVRLPVVAFDDYGHFDPTLEMKDVMVLEDGVQQQIRSIRHIPASVLIMLDLDNQITLVKNTNTTRDLAMRVISNLHRGDEVALLQFANGVKVLQDWTTSTEGIPQILKTKLLAGKRGRLSEAMVAAAKMLADKPAGSRHVVIITDGIETPGGKVAYNEAVKQLVAAQATVHIISYTAMIRDAIAGRNKKGPVQGGDGVQRTSTVGAPNPDPTMTDDLLAQADMVAHDIGAQYVITYRPTRPLASAKAGEYRRIEIAPRRTGLTLRARRGYIAK